MTHFRFSYLRTASAALPWLHSFLDHHPARHRAGLPRLSRGLIASRGGEHLEEAQAHGERRLRTSTGGWKHVIAPALYLPPHEDKMELTTEKCAEMMARNGGSLDLRGCTLPDGLTLPQTVGGWLDLSGCTLPDGLTLPQTVGGSLYLSGCTLPDGLTLPQTVGGWLYLSGEGWLLICESDFRKFAAPWFCNELDVEDVGDASGWCAEGIREAMGLLGLSDDASAYSRAEVHEALKRDAARIRDDRSEIALAILDRVAEMEAA